MYDINARSRSKYLPRVLLLIKSVFGKETSGILNWIERGNLMYADKEKSRSWLPNRGGSNSLTPSRHKRLYGILSAKSPDVNRENEPRLSLKNTVPDFKDETDREKAVRKIQDHLNRLEVLQNQAGGVKV